jgi:class 3 adenylate cyclase
MESDRTILFADVCDSTGITEVLGDVESRRYIASLLQELSEITEKMNGYVIKTIGDEIMCSFKTPTEGLAAAVSMQRALTAKPYVKGIPSRVKIGVHSGSVVIENDDVFGDVVNVAARVVSLAAAEQVLTTSDSLDDVNPNEVPFRSLGQHQVRGRDEELHLCEVLWRGETSALTAVAPKLDALPTPELEFRVEDRVVAMKSGSSEPVTLGRGGECTLVIPSNSASRAHARVVRRGGRFYLEDHSTNGTYMKPHDGNEIFVHRDQVLLQGAGRIRLGEPISVKSPLDIEFETVYRDPSKKP